LKEAEMDYCPGCERKLSKFAGFENVKPTCLACGYILKNEQVPAYYCIHCLKDNADLEHTGVCHFCGKPLVNTS